MTAVLVVILFQTAEQLGGLFGVHRSLAGASPDSHLLPGYETGECSSHSHRLLS